MEVKAKLNFLRIAPRKVRLVADLIRGKKIEEAQDILSFTVKKSAQPILKLLNSAIANATNNFQLDSTNLYISEIRVDEGPKYKRWRARARGRADMIQKKSSHISLVLDEIKSEKKKKKIHPVKSSEAGVKQFNRVKKEKSEVKRVKERPTERLSEKKKKDFKTKPEAKAKPKGRPKRIKNIFRRKAF